jgi:hypothetical protein
MKVPLDEPVPVSLAEMIRSLIRDHDVQHVDEVKWSGKKDVDLPNATRSRGRGCVT